VIEPEVSELYETGPWALSSLTNTQSPLLTFNTDIIIYTWIVLGMLLVLLIGARILLQRKGGIAQFAVVSAVDSFVSLVRQAIPDFSFSHLCFVSSMFLYIFLCNVLALIPWIEEPTADPNTTLALGITSFLYVQGAAIRTHGLWTYIKGYFSPFFVMMPINVVGKLASIVSLSFRLFGNIYGGVLISDIYLEAIRGSWGLELGGLLSGVNILITMFFGLFEGYLQAFVFTMLTLTYLATALHEGSGH